MKYGFYDRLKEGFPSQVIVDATEICNLACVHCPHPEFKKSKHYDGRHLNVELHHKMVCEVKEHGKGMTQYIRYTSNGEPLVHPHIYEMLGDAVANSGVFVTLTTNGTLLKGKAIDRLLEIGLDLVDVSIDALTPETYSKIRVNGDLKITQANVINLIQKARQTSSRTKVVVSFVEQPGNRHEAEGFEMFWKSQGASNVVIRRLHSAAGGVGNIAESLRSQQAGEARRPCLYPWERILLNPRGELAFCPQDWVHGSVIANYATTTIKEAWRGEFYRRLREAHLGNDFAKHSFCGQCPDWKATRWPGEGRSYADMIQDFKSQQS